MGINFQDLVNRVQEYPGLTDDSRKVQKGGIFVAVKGLTSDGHKFIESAVKNGAAVVVGEDERSTDGADFIKVDDSRQALGKLASAYFGDPSRKLKVIGVTGTKGKTTTVHIIHHILNTAGLKAGLVSSISTTGFHVTTPDVITLNKNLKEMVDTGCKAGVVEVSSHGIAQGRVEGIEFEVGVLTNIAPEHLDYHKTFEVYKKVKETFINTCKNKVISPRETELNILPGKFNNLNVEAAIGAVGFLGIEREAALEALKTFKLPEGRLEEVENTLGIKIVVDFAHTPDSLLAALTYLKEVTKGKLISVFGCAGERDKSKRQKMGQISGEIADLSVFTAEDPRSEYIGDIFNEMKKDAKNFICVNERGEAIAYALGLARPGDTVAIFGKGHEKSLAYKGFEHPWSDFDEIKNFLKRDKDISAVILAAGKGTRMKSEKPKSLHEICGRPMISYSLSGLRRAGVGEIVAVVSYGRDEVTDEIGGAVKIAVQEDPKGGTADAVKAALGTVNAGAKKVMVLYGDDTAFYTPETIKKVIYKHESEGAVLTFVTLTKNDPHGLGRILRSSNGSLLGIVEEKDATDEQREITEVNDGLYLFEKDWLTKNINNVEKSPVTGEYYLVDLIKMATQQGKKVETVKLMDDAEWQGVNTPEELLKAEEKMRLKLKEYSGN